MSETQGPEKVKLNTLYLFVRKLLEVETRIATRDPYDLIMSAGLLRHLLLDKLAHQTKRYFNLKINFKVGRELKVIGEPLLQYESILPRDDFKDQIEVVTLDKLLARKILALSGTVITVADVLKNCAYVRGGVHMDTNRSKIDHLLADADGVLFNGTPTTLTLLQEIVEVTLAGLKPLFDAAVDELVQFGLARRTPGGEAAGLDVQDAGKDLSPSIDDYPGCNHWMIYFKQPAPIPTLYDL